MPLVGFDDTDSSREMCTTYLTVEILKETNLDLIGYPNLVRLNPNIPLKTRGNAAISILLGRGSGKRKEIGRIYDEPVFSFESYSEEEIDIDIMRIIERFAPKEEKTNPALIITKERESEKFYWEAVRNFVDFNDVKHRIGGMVRTINGDYGIVGANAAISWPGHNYTYELISYLEMERWNGEHYVSDEGSMAIEKEIPETFDNYDFKNRYNAIRPTTKTPVLFGIRSINTDSLFSALKKIDSEPYFSFIIFKTNQGTDDHLEERTIESSKLYQSSIIKGRIISEPVMNRGGVASFEMSDGTGTIKAVAMEPTKEFRSTVMRLRKGDELRVYGGITKPGFINIEKFQLLKKSTIIEINPPLCPNCGSRMESAGRGKGYRCRKCGSKGEGITTEERRDIETGYYEVPIIARRHLARPLKLGVIK